MRWTVTRNMIGIENNLTLRSNYSILINLRKKIEKVPNLQNGGIVMKVLAINGSARKDGNTAILINTVFEELNKEGIETEMVQLSGSIIEPCKAC